jgi:hypothetical protein
VKKILFFSFVCFGAVILHAQKQSRFSIKPTSVWRVNYYFGDYTSIHSGDDLFKYYIERDTLINSIPYYKLYKSGIMYLDKPFYYDKIYLGAIRDEDNRFFFIEKNSTDEVLLYDFNLNIGDSIYSIAEKCKITINRIDTLQDGRKLFYFSKGHSLGKCLFFGSGFYIEGIGSLGGLFSESPCDHIGFRENFLICYSEDNKIVYQSNQARCRCDIVTNNPSAFSLDTSFVWKVTKYKSGQLYKKYCNYLNCDTTIESKTYLKVFESGYYIYPNDTQYFDASYVGCIRHSDNKFYFVAINNPEEVLLYDFNMKQGDIIQGLIGKGKSVIKIDTVLDNRRIFYYNDTRDDAIIEGIGSVRGLLEQPDAIYDAELNCFSKNKVPLYHYFSGIECKYSFDRNSISLCNNNTIIFSKPLLNIVNKRVAVYPVPAKDNFVVEVAGNSGIVNSVEIYNIVGIKALTIIPQDITGKIEVNTSNLKRGIYYLKVNEKDNFSMRKIILQ